MVSSWTARALKDAAANHRDDAARAELQSVRSEPGIYRGRLARYAEARREAAEAIEADMRALGIQWNGPLHPAS